jgi:hypothetical protein
MIGYGNAKASSSPSATFFTAKLTHPRGLGENVSTGVKGMGR